MMNPEMMKMAQEMMQKMSPEDIATALVQTLRAEIRVCGSECYCCVRSLPPCVSAAAYSSKGQGTF